MAAQESSAKSITGGKLKSRFSIVTAKKHGVAFYKKQHPNDTIVFEHAYAAHAEFPPQKRATTRSVPIISIATGLSTPGFLVPSTPPGVFVTSPRYPNAISSTFNESQSKFGVQASSPSEPASPKPQDVPLNEIDVLARLIKLDTQTEHATDAAGEKVGRVEGRVEGTEAENNHRGTGESVAATAPLTTVSGLASSADGTSRSEQDESFTEQGSDLKVHLLKTLLAEKIST